MGCPMEGCGKWVTNLRDTVCRRTSTRFSVTWVARGRILGGSGRLHCRRSCECWGIWRDLFGYAAGLLSAIGCLEGHSVKPVELAAMREVCRMGMGDSIGILLEPPELTSSIDALESPHSAHARPQAGRTV